MVEKSIVFIGGGNMAEGIIRGQINAKAVQPSNINVFDVIEARMDYLESKYGIKKVLDITKSINEASIIFIAVRPQDAEKVMEQIHTNQRADALIISICAGITLEKMNMCIGKKSHIARVMPNVLIEARHGYSAVCVNGMVTSGDKSDIEVMLNSLGQTMFINESLFNEFTAFSCAGPAYIMYFITAMIDAGVQSGFSRLDSAKMVLENLIGSAIMVQETGKHPYQITDTMTSPAGVTIEGLSVLSESGFHGIVMSSIKKAVERARELE